jgi:hypothetical protein
MNADFFLLNKMHRASFVLILITIGSQYQRIRLQARYIDPTFGSGGIVVTDLGGSSDTGSTSFCNRMAKSSRQGPAAPHLSLCATTPNGTLDNTFGTNGRLTAAVRDLPGSLFKRMGSWLSEGQ